MVVLDRMGFEERDLLVDLESGGTGSEDGSNEATSDGKQANEQSWDDFRSIEGSIRLNTAMNWSNGFTNSVEIPIENGQLLADKKFALGEENVRLKEMKTGANKEKKKNLKKAPKPPRPPRSPSLDAADQKLVREMSELALLKRERMERMKALKKVKNAKSASSNSNVWALVITVLFCLVIIWQGLYSRSRSNVSFEGSPESSIGTRGGLFSVQYYKNASTSNYIGSSSSSPNMVEQVSGSDDKVEMMRVAE